MWIYIYSIIIVDVDMDSVIIVSQPKDGMYAMAYCGKSVNNENRRQLAHSSDATQ